MTGAVPAGESHDPECGLLYEDGTEHCTCKLLPCPFCGSENPEWVGATDGDYVWCGSCLATMPEHDPDVPDPIQRWNTRVPATPSPQPVAEVERVEIVAKAMYDATHAGLSNCYAWDDEWEPHQEMGRARYRKEATAAIAALSALGGRA